MIWCSHWDVGEGATAGSGSEHGGLKSAHLDITDTVQDRGKTGDRIRDQQGQTQVRKHRFSVSISYSLTM